MKKINQISPAIQRIVLPFLKKKGFYLLLPAMLISLACCNSILDISPQDYLEEEQLFTSTDKVEKAVLGVYEGWYPEYLIQIASLMTDECRIGLQNTGMNAAGQCLFRHTFTSDDNEVLMPWMNYYQTIGRLNRILQNLDQTVLQDEADVSLLAALRAELLGLRAYLHFDLYRIYGYSAVFDAEAPAVPYLLESCNDSLPARPDSRTFFSRLLADLDEAEIDTPAENTGRINAVTLRGLRARMALYLKDYEMAIRAATDVIDARPLASLVAFEAVWTDQSRSEVLFFLYRNNLSLLRPGDLFYSVNEDKMLYAPSLKLMQSYSDTDIRRCWFATDQSLLPDNYADQLIKYRGRAEALNLNNLKMMRTGEFYLIRAEAFLQLGQSAQALADLNTLRLARDPEAEVLSVSAKDQIQEMITHEHFKELPFEGDRYFNLKRLNKSIERNAADVDENQNLLSSDDPHYFIPIPQSEIMTNPNIRPNNPGW